MKINVPKNATHYVGNPLDEDNVVWYKQIEIAGELNWFFKGDGGVWFLSARQFDRPDNLIEVEKNDRL